MSNYFDLPEKKKRILMITPDIMIDRRILIEAETLIDDGYEVYLLAGWDSEHNKFFEEIGRVKVERIKFEGLDSRIEWVYSLQSKLINFLNNISTKFNTKWNVLSAKGNNCFNVLMSKKNASLNNASISVQNGFGKAANKVIAKNVLYKVTVNLLKVNLKIITILSKIFNYIIFILSKLFRIFIVGGMKLKGFFILAIAKSINFSAYIIARVYPHISGFTAYEYLFYRRGKFYRPDIVHVHDLPLLRSGTRIKKDLKIPLVYDMHEFYPEQDVFTEDQRRKLRKIERKHIKYCDVLITVNPLLAKEISNCYGGVHINIIQNATIIPEGFKAGGYNKFREEYGVDNNALILLYQGWISPDRNLQNLVYALRYVNRDVKLIIMGYGEFKEELEVLARKIKVSDKIVFVPAKKQEELLFYTSSADIGIIPYPYKLDPNTKYASPNKLYEFIAAKLPIVCNQLPFVKMIVEENGFGMAVDMENSHSIAKALDSFPLSRLEEFKLNLKTKGYRYTWEYEKQKLKDAYSRFDA